MSEIPSFEEALNRFRDFLASRGHSTSLIWAFRDDLYEKDRYRMVLRWPVPSGNAELAAKVYAEGRERGLIGVDAVGELQGFTVVSAWFPKFPDEEVQGWSRNLKLAIRDPLPKVTCVPSFLWFVVRATPRYRRYQRRALLIGTRHWAAA